MKFDSKFSPAHLYFSNRSVLLNDENYLYRLREHPEKDDPDYVSVMRDPEGADDACELSDTFYFTPDNGHSPRAYGYHEHRNGFEMFMVGGENAKCLVKVRGHQTFAYPGDIIFLPPSTPHSFEWYGNPLRWREMFSGMRMNPGSNANWRILEFHPDAHEDPEFEAVYQSRSDYIPHDYPTHFEQAPEIPEIIRLNGGAAQFTLGSVHMLQKISRSQWWGQREVWQFHLPREFTVSCPHWNDKELIFMVYSGQIRVRIRGVEEFVAKQWDYLNIPPWLEAELTVLTDEAVLFDMNCTGYLYTALEEIRMRSFSDPGLLQNRKELRQILRNCSVYTWGEPGCPEAGDRQEP
ncbi:MAG: hypothetical protein ACI4LH_07490 [Candidatus Heritagella sp.]